MKKALKTVVEAGLRGKVDCTGILEEMRQGRHPE